MTEMVEEQTDMIGQNLAVGDVVAVPETKTRLGVGTVNKLTPKGAKIDLLYEFGEGEMREYEVYRRSDGIVKINPEEAFYLRMAGKVK